jgi:hypothetical protein
MIEDGQSGETRDGGEREKETGSLAHPAFGVAGFDETGEGGRSEEEPEDGDAGLDLGELEDVGSDAGYDSKNGVSKQGAVPSHPEGEKLEEGDEGETDAPVRDGEGGIGDPDGVLAG